MSNQTPNSPFPATRQDISNLTQTAADTASDIGHAVTSHANKAKSQVKKLAGHLQKEGAEQLDQVRGQLGGVLATARDYVSERPFACVGTALAVGFLIGLSRRALRS